MQYYSQCFIKVQQNMKDVLFFISTAAVIFVGFKLSEEEAIQSIN